MVAVSKLNFVLILMWNSRTSVTEEFLIIWCESLLNEKNIYIFSEDSYRWFVLKIIKGCS